MVGFFFTLGGVEVQRNVTFLPSVVQSKCSVSVFWDWISNPSCVNIIG